MTYAKPEKPVSLRSEFSRSPYQLDVRKSYKYLLKQQLCSSSKQYPTGQAVAAAGEGTYTNADKVLKSKRGVAKEHAGTRESLAPSKASVASERTLQTEARQNKREVCDKIIAIFRAKPSSEWRKLIAFSKQWRFLSDSLFARLEQQVQTENDQKEKAALRKLNRKLKEVHEELSRHNNTLEKFTTADEGEWEALVAAGRGSLTSDFFSHMENLIHASHDDNSRKNELARVATRLLMLTEAFDKVAANQDAMQTAAHEFSQLLEQVTSLEDADKRIDDLASSGKLDPALMLTMAKAYSSVKDTDYTKEEVKDVMAHLYFRAKESFAAQQPPAVRILKHILWLESPVERRQALDQAFSPGAELATATEDFLTTTPVELDTLITAILAAYDSGKNKAASQMQSEANALMNPDVIQRMRELHQQLRSSYL